MAEVDFHIALDSGAYSLYSKNIVKTVGENATVQDRMRVSNEFWKSGKGKDFRKAYVEFIAAKLEENSACFDYYITLDAIGDPENTHKNTAYIVKQGLDPVQVFHFGSPQSEWWDMVAATEYENLLALGGLTRISNNRDFIAFADRSFARIQDTPNSPPARRVHGFAMTAIPMLERYPWWSVDSAAWMQKARTGGIAMPIIRAFTKGKPEYEWLRPPVLYPVTEGTRRAPKHFEKMPEFYQATVRDYLESFFGFDPKQCGDDYFYRDVVNGTHVFMVEHALKEHYRNQFSWDDGGNIYLSGNMTSGMKDTAKFASVIQKIADVVGHHTKSKKVRINYLVSFFYRREAEFVLRVKEEHF